MAKLSYDLHIHSCLSPCGDDDMTPANIVGMAKIVGLDLIALTDHSSCKNLPAFKAAADFYEMNVLFGMELTTMEEVHVLCYFATIEDAMHFDSYVYSMLPDIPNTPELFGNQIIMDEDNENVAGHESKLLISATMIGLDEVYDLVHQFNGIMIPAHINKSSTSLLSNLGFIPEDSPFRCVEVRNPDDWPSLVEKFPHLAECRVLSSSDAHDFNTIQEPIRFLDVPSTDPHDILKVLEGQI